MSDLRSALQDAVGSRYRIGESIGRGGAGEVFRARDERHERDVAIKVLLPQVAHATGAARFEREIRLAAGLQHPHILPVFDSGGTEELLWYVMPLVEGESLDHKLDREDRLTVDEARRVCSQAAEALAYAHRRGVVHRDIKPGNLLLSEGGVLVSDFGVAMALAADGSAETLTRVGLAVGSPAYMSPEQGFGDEDVDGRSDIYSLGCVLYHCLTGRAPFGEGAARAVLARHAAEEPVPPRALREEIPASLEHATLRALEKQPEHRFSSAGEFGAAIAGRTGDTGAVGQFLRSATRRRVLNAMALYLVGVLVVVLLLALAANRLLVAPDLPLVAGTVLGLLAPAVGILAYYGREGRRLALAPVAVNVIAVLGFAILAFDWDDVLSPFEARAVVTDEGALENRRLPVPSARRRIAIFPFDGRGESAAADDWRSQGFASALESDLMQNPFFDVQTDFHSALEQAGLSGTRVPSVALMMSLARNEGYAYAVSGEYAADDSSIDVRYELYDVARQDVIDTLSLRGTDWAEATDSASVWIRESLDVPARFSESDSASVDAPVRDVLTDVDDAFAEYALGRSVVESTGDHRAAAPHFERAVELDSTFAEAWASLGTARMAGADFDAARDAVDEALKHRYRLPLRRLLKVRQQFAFLDRQEDVALQVLEQYVSIFPDDLEERYTLAAAYLQRDQPDRALAQYDTIFGMDPSYAEAGLQAVTVLLRLGMRDSALVRLSEYRRIGPPTPIETGQRYEVAGELDSARVLYEEARVADPSDPVPLHHVARLERRAGDRSEEGRLLQQAWRLADDPGDQRSTALELVRYMVTDGQLEEAGRWWDVAFDVTEETETPLQFQLDPIRSGDALVAAGRRDDARTLADAPSPLASMATIGELYTLGRLETYRSLGARDSVRAILERYPAETAVTRGFDPQRWILAMARGDAARWSSDHESARAEYEKAVRIASLYDLDRHLSALLALAENEQAAGSASGAVEILRDALRLVPSDPETHFRLGRSLLAAGDTTGARGHLDRAASGWERADPGFEGAAEAKRLLDQLGG